MSDELAADIVRLRTYLKELIAIGDAEFSNSIRFDQSNHFAFMALTFAGRQIEHGRSVLALGGSIDTMLIARSMLEGLSQLLWAAREPEDRPLRWRMFALVRDWRTMRKEEKAGRSVAAERRTYIEDGLSLHGDRFLSARSRKAKANGEPFPGEDPYALNWYDEKEKAVFDGVEGATAYEELYRPFSEWHHWRIGGFGRVMTFDPMPGAFTMSLQDDSSTATALGTACQCLYQTLDVLADVVPGGMRDDLNRWYARYVADIGGLRHGADGDRENSSQG